MTFDSPAAEGSTSSVTSSVAHTIDAGPASISLAGLSNEEHGSPSASGKQKTTKRRKVNHACLYCRRSHMTCDEGRPCKRCVKREIGHLCHDEQRAKTGEKAPAATTSTSNSDAEKSYSRPLAAPVASSSSWPMNNNSMDNSLSFMYGDTLGNEFSVLTDFLETLDEGSFFTAPSMLSPSTAHSFSNTALSPSSFMSSEQSQHPAVMQTEKPPDDAPAEILPAATKTERFLLTAADQESGSRDERLSRVIRSKYEAGLLKPYNYVTGYARLSRWMDRNVSQDSKQQILQPLSVLRPKFRAVAKSLQDIDLVFIEEAFERLLLDYDRVFSAMGVPACLWRRTGEIYKANREFAELVGLDGIMMRDGRVCIYELMAEESAVNYWEKYGHVAFDSSQKAVLTSCVLRYRPVLNPSPTVKDKQPEKESPNEEALVSCCFSFTIRRDKWGIPSMIVGNFIKC